MGEEAKYKHEMEAQLRKAEMKVDQARSEASMALHAAQQDANAGSRARLRAAQEHEEHALAIAERDELSHDVDAQPSRPEWPSRRQVFVDPDRRRPPRDAVISAINAVPWCY